VGEQNINIILIILILLNTAALNLQLGFLIIMTEYKEEEIVFEWIQTGYNLRTSN